MCGLDHGCFEEAERQPGKVETTLRERFLALWLVYTMRIYVYMLNTAERSSRKARPHDTNAMTM